MRLKKMHIGLIFMYLIAFVSCSKEELSNQIPKLDIHHKINGLEVILTGGALDSDGTISMIKVDWGDNNIDKFVHEDFSNLEKTHTYSSPATYDISITVSDNDGDSTYLPLTVSVDYKEISLDNIKQTMFKASANEYLILTINQHTYQESHQNEKFNMLVELIGRMDVDFIALQECAQRKTANIVEGIIREDNMALIISNHLKEKYGVEYSYIWDWAHYGWDNWEEGVAILSKHSLVESESRYISSNTSVNNISSRKVVYGSYQTPDGEIHIFSAHTHWRTSTTDEEQNNQITNIQLMADEKELLSQDRLTFICGDFNGNPTSDYPWSEGYNTLINDGEYIDTFLDIYPDANNKPAQNIYNTIGGNFPGRIDYIFAKSNPKIKILDSQIIFTDNIIGKISDHSAILTKVTFVR